jgi:nitrogen regulatory protein P-II 1
MHPSGRSRKTSCVPFFSGGEGRGGFLERPLLGLLESKNGPGRCRPGTWRGANAAFLGSPSQHTQSRRGAWKPAHPTVKQVVAIVKPYLAEKVLESLKRAPLEALNVREVKGYGRQKNYLDEYGDTEFSLAYLPKVEIAMWVDDARVEEIVRKIVEVARTGRMGDGKVFVVPVESYECIIDIATGESSAR